MNTYNATYKVEGTGIAAPSYADILSGITGTSVLNWRRKETYQFKAENDKKARDHALAHVKTLLEYRKADSAELIGLEKIIDIPIK